MSSHTSTSRRRFLRTLAVLVGGLPITQTLVACQPKVVEVTRIVREVVKETVVVPGTPEVVEKLIEKEITVLPPQPRPTKELAFWMWNTYAPAADNIMELAIRRWAQDNEVQIDISRDSEVQMREKVMPALEAGTLPDAMFVDSDDGLLMGEASGLDPLTDLFGEIGDVHGGWQPRLSEYTVRDGVAFFLPYSIDTPMVHYRTDVLEKAGVKAPEGQWTWDETRDLCKAAMDWTEKQGSKMIGWGFGTVKQQHDGWCRDVFRNFGADIWDETGHNVILKDQKQKEAVEALKFMAGAWDKGLFPADSGSWDWLSNNKAYQEEQAILVVSAASLYTWCAKNKPQLAELTSLAPKPKAVRATTDAALRSVVVLPQVSKDKALARELIRALYTADVYAPWLAEGFVSHVLKEYDTLAIWTGKRASLRLAAQVAVYGGYPAPYENPAMTEVLGPNDAVGSMTVRVLIDRWEPERAIDEADAFAKGVFGNYFG